MKNAKNVNFLQVDNKPPKLVEEQGVVILPSTETFKKIKWTRKYFLQKPKEGYFVWVKKQIDFPLTTCITISSSCISQKPTNLIVIEKNIKSQMYGACNAITKNLSGIHSGYSKIVLKENSKLKLNHFHSWGKKDKINSSIDFTLKEGAKLSYVYKCLETPIKLKTQSNIYLEKNASSNIKVTVSAKNSKIDMSEFIYLDGKNSNGISRIRIVGNRKSKIVAHNRMIANKAGTGHVDCMGLLIANNSSINLIPELINKNKNASLTHEASVGKISEENLNYLRSRGLTEEQAIDLIVAGFLANDKK